MYFELESSVVPLMVVEKCESPVHGSSASSHVSKANDHVSFTQLAPTESHVDLDVAVGSEQRPHSSSDVLVTSEQLPRASQSNWFFAIGFEHVPSTPAP
mmetsp:Transcript_34487/g.79715  ORF Transcript_34487/g.79715 Transcript_34487/m.79715 type:complete len:99 (-) Transcript_34487:305-601(-)